MTKSRVAYSLPRVLGYVKFYPRADGFAGFLRFRVRVLLNLPSLKQELVKLVRIFMLLANKPYHP